MISLLAKRQHWFVLLRNGLCKGSHQAEENEQYPLLPTSVIFGPGLGSGSISRLKGTPVHPTKRQKISTRFKPMALPRGTPSDGIVSILLNEHWSDESSHSSIASRSYASSLSGLSHVSRRSLHPTMPLCSLQSLEAWETNKASHSLSKKRKQQQEKRVLKQSQPTQRAQVSA